MIVMDKSDGDTMRLAIVGAQEDRWNSFERTFIEDLIRGMLAEDEDGVRPIVISGHCPMGGVDIWAEEIAEELGCKMVIYAPEVNQWEDRITQYDSNEFHDKGYKSRNIQIAEACDTLVCFSPAFQHGKNPTLVEDIIPDNVKQIEEIWNGGVWTAVYAQKIGKRVLRVVVKDLTVQPVNKELFQKLRDEIPVANTEDEHIRDK